MAAQLEAVKVRRDELSRLWQEEDLSGDDIKFIKSTLAWLVVMERSLVRIPLSAGDNVALRQQLANNVAALGKIDTRLTTLHQAASQNVAA